MTDDENEQVVESVVKYYMECLVKIDKLGLLDMMAVNSNKTHN